MNNVKVKIKQSEHTHRTRSTRLKEALQEHVPVLADPLGVPTYRGEPFERLQDAAKVVCLILVR